MNKIFSRITKIVLFLILWYLLIFFLEVPVYILPSPLAVFKILIKSRNIILSNAFVTFSEAFLGFLFANLISILIALLIAFYRQLEDVVMPIAIILKTIPIVALVPLLTIWFGSGIFSKVVTAMLICFFPALINVLRGIKSLDSNLLSLFKIYAANKVQLTRKLILPAIQPYLFAALKVSSSLAIIGALVGEFIGSNKGLGFLIISNYYNMNITFVFAVIMVSSIIGILFYYSIHFFERKMVFESEMIT